MMYTAAAGSGQAELVTVGITLYHFPEGAVRRGWECPFGSLSAYLKIFRKFWYLKNCKCS